MAVQSGVEITAVAHVIQQAVAPVFLLTGVGAILGVLTNRLSRIIDRVRVLATYLEELDTRAEPALDAEHKSAAHRRSELAMLARRRTWIHRAIMLCTMCALLVCVVIASLFLASEFVIDPSRVVAALFVTAMASLIGGLLCFLAEIRLATQQFYTH